MLMNVVKTKFVKPLVQEAEVVFALARMVSLKMKRKIAFIKVRIDNDLKCPH